MSNPKFCLFEGRHDLPVNQGPLYVDFDFQNFEPIPSPNLEIALEEIKSGDGVEIYTTGLTPALLHFIGEVAKIDNGALFHTGLITFLNYDRESGQYRPQKL